MSERELNWKKQVKDWHAQQTASPAPANAGEVERELRKRARCNLAIGNHYDSDLDNAAADLIAALQERERGLREALERQTDNMAFVLNHVDLHKWADKFNRELNEDRAALAAQQGSED